MGAIAQKLTSFKQPKQLKPKSGRRQNIAIRPTKSKGAFKVNMRQAYSDAHRMVGADEQAERKAVTAGIRTAKFGNRLRNAGTIQGGIDGTMEAVDQMIVEFGDLNGEEQI